MQILYDHQVFSWQTVGGISRYFAELIGRLGATNSTLISNNQYLSNLQPKPVTLLKAIYIPGKTQFFKLINKINSIRILKNGQYDIFHPTYYDPYFLPYLGAKPYVVTVFDMIHELYPREFPGDNTTALKKSVLTGASKIIAISQNTKADLIKLFRIESSKIEVVYLGSSLNSDEFKPVDLPAKYLLYVGDRGKYKNFTGLVRAMQKVEDLPSDLHLVCVGGGKFTGDEKQMLGELLPVSHQLSLKDLELTYAYKHALCFVAPSLYEGFCLPVLEAMVCGCPVACSNTSSIPEVVGEAGIYFDPNSSPSISSALTTIITDQPLRTKLIKQGLVQASKFSWSKCAKQTDAIYSQIIK